MNPPRFVISVNNAGHFHFSYTRYMENKIREIFGFEGTPIDIELRSRKSIYKDKDKGLDIEESIQSDDPLDEERKQKKKENKKKQEYRKSKKFKKS